MSNNIICFEIFGFNVEFGWNSVIKLGGHVEDLGARKALIVTDTGVLKTDAFKKVTEILATKGIQFVVFENVLPNPTDVNVNQGAQEYRRENCDIVIGLGGGSPMDAAKGIRVLSSHPGQINDYFGLDGTEKITNPLPPLIAIPTTSGTGSEVSRGAVITDTNRQVKCRLRGEGPNVSIVDPELTLSMPPQLTAATGMDALSHSIEAFLSPTYHPVADAIALEGIRLVSSYLPRAFCDAQDREARIGMSMASTMGALAFQKGLGAVHSLAHQLSTQCDISHGMANAIMLPPCMEYNRKVAEEKIARIALAMGETTPSAETGIESVLRLSKAIGIHNRLSKVGAKESDIPIMANNAMKDWCYLTNPRPCTEHDMAMLYRQAL